MARPEESEKFVADNLNAGALEADLKYEVDGEVRFDSTSRALYSTDASNYRQIPIGVVIPRTREAVVKTLEICHRHRAPVVSRGGGTGLCGQTCNVAVVIDHSKYLNKILELNVEERWARVEPGVILDHLRDLAEEHHLTFGPDPATHNHNTLGGMIGNNSCGTHSVMAGKTVDNILEMEVVTYDGVRLTVGPTSERELKEIIAEGGRRGEIYAGLKEIRDRYGDEIRARYPKIPRRVSGYNLDELLRENDFNVARALVGSESTLVTVLEAKVRLVHSPPARSVLVCGYPDVYSAGDHIPDLMKFKPVALEGLDNLLVDFMKKMGEHLEDLTLLPSGGGWLVAEFGGDTKEESDGKAKKAMEVLFKADNPPAMKLYVDPKEETRMWEIRESGLGATANVPGLPLSWPGWEDAAVPPDKLGGYLREFKQLLDDHKLIASLYGHFGDGCIHCSISFELASHAGVSSFMSFLDKASDLVVKYGGSFSAEHGDGQSKAIFLRKMFGDDLIEAFRKFKFLWDPQWKMNPGKIVDPYLPDQNLRLGLDYNPRQPDTWFKYPSDQGSYATASLRCAGVGNCRRTHDAFMCPSFLATREEMHTTRGRARVLFEMMRNSFIKDGWKSKEVREALELCLCCKGCKGECPVNVDMATYKAEFLSHYYRHRLRPLAAYSMGLFGVWGRVGARMPRIANFFTHAPFFSTVMKEIGGIAGEREMPVFATESFTDWYRQREKQPDTGRKVVLYPDIFNDCFFPETLRAALEVLERFGYSVIVPDDPPSTVRPPMDYGMIAYARKRVLKVVEQMSTFTRRGIPIVVMEPSTAAVFRDELPNLMPTHEDGKRMTANTMVLAEYMKKEGLEGPKFPAKALLQTHCHQKAVLDGEAEREVLRKMGVDFSEPEQGCCGMAGSFGFERDKYEVSMKIAEQNLLPAVKGAPTETFIIADGFSCRTQIMQGTNRQVIHLAEFLKLAFDRAEEAGMVTPRDIPPALNV
ncbi:dimethylmenaquinone methyltransferase [Geomonas sp. Red276]